MTAILPCIAKSDTTEMNISNSSKPKRYNNLLFLSAVPYRRAKYIQEIKNEPESWFIQITGDLYAYNV